MQATQRAAGVAGGAAGNPAPHRRLPSRASHLRGELTWRRSIPRCRLRRLGARALSLAGRAHRARRGGVASGRSRRRGTRYAIGVVDAGVDAGRADRDVDRRILDGLSPPSRAGPAVECLELVHPAMPRSMRSISRRASSRAWTRVAVPASTPALASGDDRGHPCSSSGRAASLLLSVRLAGGWLVARRLARRSIVPARPEIRDARAPRGRTARARSRRARVRVVGGRGADHGRLAQAGRAAAGAALCGLAPTQIEALIAHELAHVRRHDYLVNLLQSAVETLLVLSPGRLVGLASGARGTRALLRRSRGRRVRSARVRHGARRSRGDEHAAPRPSRSPRPAARSSPASGVCSAVPMSRGPRMRSGPWPSPRSSS